MARNLIFGIDIKDMGTPALKRLTKQIKRTNKPLVKTTQLFKAAFGSQVVYGMLSKLTGELGEATQQVLAYNQAMQDTQALSGLASKEIGGLSSVYRDLAKNTEHGLAELSKAGRSIIKQGFDPEELEKMMPDVADLATAGLAENIEQAGDLLTRTMRSFGKSADDAGHVASVLQKTIAGTATDFGDLQNSMKYVAPIAQNIGVSLEETASIIGHLGNMGIRGSKAGTQLKNMLLNIMKTSPGVKEALSDMNMQSVEFTDILKELHDDGVSAQEILETFNKRAVAGAMGIGRLAEKVKDFTDELSKNDDSLSSIAEKMRDTVGKQANMLRNRFVLLAKDLVDTFAPQLKSFIKDMQVHFENLSKWVNTNQEKITEFAKLIGDQLVGHLKVFVSVMGAIVKHHKAFLSGLSAIMALRLVGWFTKVTAGASSFGAALKALCSSAGPIYILSLALIELIRLLDAWQDRIDENVRKTTHTLGTVEGLEANIKAIDKLQKKYGGLYKEWAKIRSVMDATGNRQAIAIAIKILNEEGRYTMAAAKKLALRIQDLQEMFQNVSSRGKMGTGLTLITADEQKRLEENFGKGVIEKIEKAWQGEGDIINRIQLIELKKWEKHIKKVHDVRVDGAKKTKESVDKENVKTNLKDIIEGLEDGVDTTIKLDFKYNWNAIEFYEKWANTIIDSTNEMNKTTKKLLNNEAMGKDLKAFQEFVYGGIENLDLGQLKELYSELTEETKKYGITLEEQMQLYALIKKKEEELAKERKENLESIREKWEMWIGTAKDLASTTFDFMHEMRSAETDAYMDLLDEEESRIEQRYKREVAVAQESEYLKTVARIKREREEARIEQERMRREKQQKEKEKNWAVTEALILGAIGSMQIWAGPESWQEKLAQQLVLAAQTTAEVVAISAADYKRTGGYIDGIGGSMSDSNLIHASKGEYMLDADTVKALGGKYGVEKTIDDKVNNNYNNSTGDIYNIENMYGSVEFVDQLADEIERRKEHV